MGPEVSETTPCKADRPGGEGRELTASNRSNERLKKEFLEAVTRESEADVESANVHTTKKGTRQRAVHELLLIGLLRSPHLHSLGPTPVSLQFTTLLLPIIPLRGRCPPEAC